MDGKSNSSAGNSINPLMSNCQTYEMAMYIAVILVAFTVILSLICMLYQASSLKKELKEYNMWYRKFDEHLRSKNGDGIEATDSVYIVNSEKELLLGRNNKCEDSEDEFNI
ncbi:hypothetical protein PGAL8A_00266100 [Plasmodium gallinaceum]|uniref:Uncharacterized protein n=1 Tax=Plasmodium gallinaceum TaxID=5849 RepID=A0A1J1GVY8_PLAGA|nr:hypothetical protein PGAL8A_00266100 [Plasmodium gallinaceum]CRG95458.1 hypothetical protein PGAL8A_00266100 [Plasmodium gallinaceum]